ncbi:uncharacterized protein LOC111326521 [Stylophora pistillata]|uniref:Transmembrane protein 272 n=1 Tax=Stylophora pistillata TaxID=50429 RepID=A0A2B4SFW2_STYPI|nr:uncharacterized protein LOC111326521 [Stylophora pistillata]PFX28256.1 hypothetical protein AWC38_SpisGene7048 [Stylophora pistillata]
MEAIAAGFWGFLVSLLTAMAFVSLASIPLQIAMIVIGAKYKDDCPVEEMIPIYLIVAGAASLFANCCTCGVKYNQQENDGQTVNPLQALVQFFLFAWFICGNVWIYTNYEPNYTDPSSLGYCHKTLYLFAFWATNSAYILHGFVLVCFCCLGTCTAAAGVAQVV